VAIHQGDAEAPVPEANGGRESTQARADDQDVPATV
jgi:hypothetical protein